jgi:hypothetical protein
MLLISPEVADHTLRPPRFALAGHGYPFTTDWAIVDTAMGAHHVPQEGIEMGIGVSLFLIALGAILAFAVNAAVDGLELDTIGWILMVIGGIGLLLSLLFWSTWGGFAGRRRETVVEERREVL